MDITHGSLTKARNSKRAPNHFAVVIGALYVIIAGVALALLAVAAHTTHYFDVDLLIARAVQSIQAPWFDLLMRGVGWPGYPPQLYIGLALIFLVLFFLVSRWAAVAHLFATVGIGAIGLAVKLLVDRPRPSPGLIHVANPGLDGGKFSFTAGHVESYVAILGFLMFLVYLSQNRSLWRTLGLIVFGVMIALIGLARIYSGEHWFSDVAGGYLLGSIWLVLTIRFYDWGKSRFFVKKAKR